MSSFGKEPKQKFEHLYFGSDTLYSFGLSGVEIRLAGLYLNSVAYRVSALPRPSAGEARRALEAFWAVSVCEMRVGDISTLLGGFE